MSDLKIPALLGLSLLSSPVAVPTALSASMPFSVEQTSQRASIRNLLLQVAPVPLLQPMGTYVGELQERWQFPSDHLPIAMTFDDFHFVSWNVLDADYMSWVTEKDSQGLSRSMIADEHVYIGDSKLTIRDRHIVDLILQMISHPTHPRSVLSLQECSKPFIEELRSRLPAHFEIIANHGEVVLLDRRRFELIEAKEGSGIFSNEPYRTLQDLSIRRLDNGQLLRIVNAHLPGDPTKPARFEFARYLSDTFDPTLSAIAMGDMNFNELEMADAMQQAFEELLPQRKEILRSGKVWQDSCHKWKDSSLDPVLKDRDCAELPVQNGSPFSLYSPYCTNISPYAFRSKAIDHFLVYSPDASPIVLHSPDQILRGLDRIASLLQ